jgi:hypothetical protein
LAAKSIKEKIIVCLRRVFFFFLLEQKETKIQDNSPTTIYPAKASRNGGSHRIAKPTAPLPTYELGASAMLSEFYNTSISHESMMDIDCILMA